MLFPLKCFLKSVITNLGGLLFVISNNYFLKKSLTVFIYHDVSDNPSEFSSRYNLNVCPETFDYQLRFINNNFNIVSPDDLLNDRIPSKAALITFDDGFRSFFTTAIPILVKYNIPSIIFLNMEAIKGAVFWSGLVTYLCEKEDDFRNYVRNRLSNQIGKRPLFLSCTREIVGDYLKIKKKTFYHEVSHFVGDFATEEDLNKVSENPLVIFGNHLYNHDVPLLMSNNSLLESYNKNVMELNKYYNYRDIFSFPFGQPVTSYDKSQVEIILKNGAARVFRSTGSINFNVRSLYLDRITLTSSHDSAAKIWFQVFQRTTREWLRSLIKHGA